MYITVPNNNIVERYYIINILFHEFLGLKYEICVANDEKDYTVILDNGRKLIIKDSFFNLFPKNFGKGRLFCDEAFSRKCRGRRTSKEGHFAIKPFPGNAGADALRKKVIFR